ncbi:MAG: prefoldin subunit beta [Candidatus Aenigmarchaeota archaeon]|nr:prefoldin subunit beta [Candidatus Aenigmarchaeota archaeon]
MVDVEDSKNVQQLLGQAQLYQQQMQSILNQKELISMQVMEIDKALEALETTKEKDVFKISGPILIKTGKILVKKELKEKKEAISLRIKSLEKGENRLKAQIEELRARLSKNIKV